MDRILRRQLDAIARDNHSGAVELTLRAVSALEAWLQRHARPSKPELLNVARASLKAQPSMAPLLRLANEVALATDDSDPGASLHKRLRIMERTMRTASDHIATHFRRWLSKNSEQVLMTYSYSSTVIACLIRSRSSLHSVFCSEGRPAGEGFEMARRLAAAGIRVTFCTDAGLTGQVWPKQILLLGVDAVLNGDLASKVGTKALIELNLAQKCPVVIATDTTKLWREPHRDYVQYWSWKFGSGKQLWGAPPRIVDVYNPYFELTPISPRLRFVTERGWMTPTQVRRELKKIRISPRLKELID